MEILPPLEGPVPRLPQPEPGPAAESPEGARFGEILRAIGKRVDRGERLIEGALHPRSGMDAAELIALQAGIYRYTEAIELASKLVDRASNAVRTTLQSQ